jgi:hypothetical protein
VGELDVDLREVIEGFVRQPGNAILNVQRLKNNILRVVKKPMAIPYNFILSSMESPSAVNWLPNGFDEVITIPSLDTAEWFLLNIDQFAFYRVNYGVDNWRALIEALRENPETFSTQTRAQLIDDSLSLAREGFLSYAIALDMVMNMEVENSFLPWSAATRNLLQLNNLLTSSDIHHDFQVNDLMHVSFICSVAKRFSFSAFDAGAERELLDRTGIR